MRRFERSFEIAVNKRLGELEDMPLDKLIKYLQKTIKDWDHDNVSYVELIACMKFGKEFERLLYSNGEVSGRCIRILRKILLEGVK